jgi:hypothetical protein
VLEALQAAVGASDPARHAAVFRASEELAGPRSVAVA